MNDFRLLNSAPLKPRAILTRSQAVEIFQLKATLKSSTRVSKMYGVCEKAIRDIWAGRTWKAETWHLDPSRPLEIKYTGRPVGRRDAKPRRNTQEKELSYSMVILKSADHELRVVKQPTDKDCSECKISGAKVTNVEWPNHQQSLDELLFYWEHSLPRETADPFQGDWTL